MLQTYNAKNAELIVNISASPWQRGKEATRLAMLQRVARDERVPLRPVALAVPARGEQLLELVDDQHQPRR